MVRWERRVLFATRSASLLAYRMADVDVSSHLVHHQCLPRAYHTLFPAQRSLTSTQQGEYIPTGEHSLDCLFIRLRGSHDADGQYSITTRQMSWSTARRSLWVFGIRPVRRITTVSVLCPTPRRTSSSSASRSSARPVLRTCEPRCVRREAQIYSPVV